MLADIVAAKHCGRHKWKDIGREIGITWQAARAKYLHRDKQLYPKGQLPTRCPICSRIGVSFNVHGNYATATSTDGRVRSLEDLCAHAKVDLDEWQLSPNGFKVGTYEGWAKREDKDLTFAQGIISGHARSKGVIIETLYRTEARFVRKNPVPVRPIIQPIQCNVTFAAQKTAQKTEGKWLLLADPHFGYEWKPPQWDLVPFHDRAAIDTALQIAEIVQPDGIDILGDILDLATWTDRFARRPEYYMTTQPAICEAHWWLRQFRVACPDAQFRLHGGNHDARMETTLETHIRDACDLRPAEAINLPPAMSLPNLLALASLGIEWVPCYPDDIAWIGNAMQTRHGNIARSKTLATVTALVENTTINQACGHIHRDEMASRAFRNDRGDIDFVTAYCPGGLCHIDGRVPGSTSTSNWRQGVGLVEYNGAQVTITHIPIRSGAALYGGQTFMARNRRGDLKHDMPEWNW